MRPRRVPVVAHDTPLHNRNLVGQRITVVEVGGRYTGMVTSFVPTTGHHVVVYGTGARSEELNRGDMVWELADPTPQHLKATAPPKRKATAPPNLKAKAPSQSSKRQSHGTAMVVFAPELKATAPPHSSPRSVQMQRFREATVQLRAAGEKKKKLELDGWRISIHFRKDTDIAHFWFKHMTSSR